MTFTVHKKHMYIGAGGGGSTCIQELVEEVGSEEYERDITTFIEDLEEDKSYRQNINISLGMHACAYVFRKL